MYRVTNHQITFFDFNQSCGMQLDEKNEWIVLADSIDWDRWESEYAKKFESPRGNPAKPLRMALGALLVQKRKGLSDRKLVAEIAENPYVQYFLGLPNFTSECPFTAPALVYFRQRLNADMIMKINDMYLEQAEATPEHREENESDRAKKANEPEQSRDTDY